MTQAQVGVRLRVIVRTWAQNDGRRRHQGKKGQLFGNGRVVDIYRLPDCFYMRATLELPETEKTWDDVHTSSSSNVLILHSKSATFERERFRGFLRDVLGEEPEAGASCVAFDDLQTMPSSIEADSRPAEVVVLITAEEENVPPAVYEWTASWLNRAGPDSALIGLVAGVYHETAAWRGLHRACDQAGVTFFATGLQNEKSTI
jgi:hypothetical protein